MARRIITALSLEKNFPKINVIVDIISKNKKKEKPSFKNEEIKIPKLKPAIRL